MVETSYLDLLEIMCHSGNYPKSMNHNSNESFLTLWDDFKLMNPNGNESFLTLWGDSKSMNPNDNESFLTLLDDSKSMKSMIMNHF